MVTLFSQVREAFPLAQAIGSCIKIGESGLSDSGATAMEWGAWGERPVAGIAGTGVIRSSFIVDANGSLSYVAYDIDPNGHVQELRAQLGV